MRAVVVMLAGLCLAPEAMAQSVVDCEVVERVAQPTDVHEGARYAVELRNGRVRMVLRRATNQFSTVIDLVPHQRIAGGSFQHDVGRRTLGAEAVMWLAIVQDNGVIMFDEFVATDDNNRRTATRLTVFLRCPAPS